MASRRGVGRALGRPAGALVCGLGLALGLAATALPAHEIDKGVAERVDDRADELAELRRRLDEQEEKIRILERKLELSEAAARAVGSNTPMSAAPVVQASPQQGFSIQSADGANVARLRDVHFDGRYFPDDTTPATADTWLLRRVRPTLEGTLNGIYDFRITPDFGGGRAFILDAFMAARLQPWAVVTVGKFKVPVGLERLVSSPDLRFIERGFPTSLVPNRDLGVQLGGDIDGGVVNYSIGYFNGVRMEAAAMATRPTPTSITTPKAIGRRACSSNRSCTRTTWRCAVWVSESRARM